MNQRIKELANQMFSMEQFEYAEEFLNDEFMEKFAELIVRDVIGIVEGYCETSPEIYGLPLEILEHFDMELKDV